MKVKSPLRLAVAILILLMIIYAGFQGVISIITGEPIKFGFWSGRGVNHSENIVDFVVAGTDNDGALTDLILFCRYNSADNSLTALQIPRDTKVQNKRWDKKINSAYGHGGTEVLYDEIEGLIGIRPEKYVVMNLKAFREVIDAIGGVEFNVPMRMYYEDPFQNLVIDLQKGEQVLDGRHAEMFMRFRSGYKNGDVERNEAQRAFYDAVLDKILSGRTVLKVPKLLSIFNKNVKTDFTGNDIIKYIGKVPKLDREKVNIMALPGEGGYEGAVSYFFHDKEETEKIVKEYFKETRLSDSVHINPVKNRFIKVKVIDASGISIDQADILKAISETLTEYGFNVIATERSDKIRDRSCLINNNVKGAAQEIKDIYQHIEIEEEVQKYEGKEGEKTPDVTLIIGNDFSY